MAILLGISGFYHDSAAALVRDGEIVAAAQEERFTRIKHDAAFPQHAVQFCLEAAGVSINDLDCITFYDKPFLKFERLMETYASFAPRGFSSFRKAIPVWLREKLFLKDLLCKEFKAIGASTRIAEKLRFSEHHLSHAASAFFPSPFENAVVLTMDGVGESATTSLALGEGNNLDIVKEIHFPHSLGLLYSAFTYYTGFKVNSGEYKLMGLAPYGQPVYAQKILDHLIDLKNDGSFWLDMAFFDYATDLTMVSKKFVDFFGQLPRAPEAPLTQFHMDIAASIQVVAEEVVLRLTRDAYRTFGIPNLCLAGGVALNCVANGKILRDGRFQNVWVQPAAGDAGGALGAALATHHLHMRKPRVVSGDKMRGAYLGSAFTQQQIEDRLGKMGAVYQILDDTDFIEQTADLLAQGKALGWFQGRMEFGPRALGGRSILGDPRSPTMQSALNLKIKYRESFRPFAPSVLREHVGEWFDLNVDSPYMLMVANVKEEKCKKMTSDEEKLFGIDKLNVPRSEIPAVTHVDYSARIQTVHADTNPRYHALISAFYRKTGCPVLVNTSFNVRGEPIVCTPEDAFRCFMGTELDVLAIGNCVLFKDAQNKNLARSYAAAFAPD